MKPGDRVIRTTFGRRTHGTIVKMRKVSALVRFDGACAEERVYLDALRPETAEDVARRDLETALRAWRDQRPDTVQVRVQTEFSGRETGVALYGLTRDPEAMRQAARELIQFAEWFEVRPDAVKEPKR